MSRQFSYIAAIAIALFMYFAAVAVAGAKTEVASAARHGQTRLVKHHRHHRHHKRHHRHKRHTVTNRSAHAAGHHHKLPAPEETKQESATPPPTTAPEPVTSPSGSVAFSATSPWNVSIPANPALDANSTSIAGYLGGEMKAYADMYEYGTPVWESTSTDPYNSVKCTEPWGACALSQQTIPIPTAAGTSGGSDGSMVVIDTTSHVGYDFWQASRTSSTSWSTSWGTSFSMEGSGTGGGATGAGVPLLAGLPRLAEMTNGRINHALGFISDNTCAGSYRFPASKTDGKSTRGDCTPEGTRIQLDPSINVDAIPGITPGEKIVAHALQTYGAYCKDSGGSKLAFGFEDPVGKTNPYPTLGFNWDYYDMPHIPWNHLRVLNQWNGS